MAHFRRRGKKYTADEKKVIEIAEEVTVMPYVHPHPTSLTSDQTPFAKDRFSRSRCSYVCLSSFFTHPGGADVSPYQ